MHMVLSALSLNEDLFKGHVGLSEALAAEVKARPDAKKALAREARAQAQSSQGAQGAAPARRCACPLGGVPPPPTVVAGGVQGLRGPAWTVSWQWATSWVRAAPDGRPVT